MATDIDVATDVEGWFLAAACRTRACPRPAAPPHVRFRDLPARSQRELASIALAGIASTVLMLVPVALAVPYSVVLPATPLPVSVVAAPALPPGVPLRVQMPSAPADDDLAPVDSAAHADSPEASGESTPATSR